MPVTGGKAVVLGAEARVGHPAHGVCMPGTRRRTRTSYPPFREALSGSAYLADKVTAVLRPVECEMHLQSCTIPSVRFPSP